MHHSYGSCAVNTTLLRGIMSSCLRQSQAAQLQLSLLSVTVVLLFTVTVVVVISYSCWCYQIQLLCCQLQLSFVVVATNNKVALPLGCPAHGNTDTPTQRQ